MIGQELTGNMSKNLSESYEMTEAELQSDIARFQPTLYRLAYSYIGSGADCDDIMQDVFIKLFYRKRRFPDDEAKKAWLIRVTVNCCKNRVSHWWNKKRGELPEAAVYSEAEEYPELEAALKKLKPMYRTVIYLHYYEGYTSAEIAKLLNISVTAVTTRLQRGREKLRGMLEEQEE